MTYPPRAKPPLRTLAQVKDTLRQCIKSKADVAMARAMLRHGRLTPEARAYVQHEYQERIARLPPL